jgi:aspartyl-tRNA(Asn)/glutamyl-tRNA(Gln) amidotransferase subunit B
VSVRPVGATELRTRTEVKNLNSIRSLNRATEYEIARQIEVWESGETVIQQTMGWDEDRQVTIAQRSKESAHDYRYFPEPDLPNVQIAQEDVDAIRAQMPELPDAKQARYEKQFKLTPYNANVLVADRPVAEYFEAAIAAGGDPTTLANWIIGEMFRLMNRDSLEREEISGTKVTPQRLVALTKLIGQGVINNNTGKQVLDILYEDGGEPDEIVKAKGLAQESDTDKLAEAVATAISENPDEVARYLAGEQKVFGFLMGQVMRSFGGKAPAQTVKELLTEQLGQ